MKYKNGFIRVTTGMAIRANQVVAVEIIETDNAYRIDFTMRNGNIIRTPDYLTLETAKRGLQQFIDLIPQDAE